MCACAAFVLPAPGPPRAAAPRAAATQEEDPSLPEPRVGDVVAFAGDWPGETSVGQIRSLQPRGDRWLADVVPLEDQAGDVWRLPAAALARKRRTAVDVAELVPLEAAPAAEDDAFVLTATEPSAAIKPLSGSAAGLLARGPLRSARRAASRTSRGSAPSRTARATTGGRGSSTSTSASTGWPSPWPRSWRARGPRRR